MHQELAQGRWHTLSLASQMAHIGSEVSRMVRAQNEERRMQAFTRGLELFDLTLADVRWKGRHTELARARETLCDGMFGGKEYGTDIRVFQRYFDQFALAQSAGIIGK